MVLRFEPLLIHYQKDELDVAINKAIDKAYRRENGTLIADPDEIKRNVKSVLDDFSRSKRGRHYDAVITTAINIFLEELKRAGLTPAKFRRLSEPEREKFWTTRVWATRRAEIIPPDELVRLKSDHQAQMKEQKRIEDRVRRWLKSPYKGRERINYRPK